MDTNYFARLAQINVNEHIERKGDFAYLSWTYAVQQLRLADPAATWEVRRFEGLPYLKTETGFFVEVAVIVQGITLSQIHPVLDSRNRPIEKPSCFDINTALARCLVKAIALHGLGLYVYAGEDLPQPDKTAPVGPKSAVPATVKRVSQFQVRKIEQLMTQVGADRDRLLSYFAVSSLSEVPASQYARVIRSLENHRRAAA
jgi:hypothetical protein